MNLITGIIKKYYRSILPLLVAIVFVAGCKHGAAADDDDDAGGGSIKITARAEVNVVSPNTGTISEYETLNATTVFLLNDAVRAPIAGYIKKVEVTPGQFVKQGDVLFSIQGKEAAAIKDSLFPSRGMIVVKATEAGVVKGVDRQQGDYLQDGDEFCTIANNASLVFMLDVPFELHKYIKTDRIYSISLPDGETTLARITSQIPEMDRTVQMERYVLRPETSLNLPEGLITNVKIPTTSQANATILPKKAVLSNETQSEFWVMKVLHDSLAVKINVQKGLETKDSIEIKSPAFSKDDRILVSGNYGVPDTVKIKIVK
jgi:hypothetical protein